MATPLSIRFSDDERELLKKLAEINHSSELAVLVACLRQRARQEGLLPPLVKTLPEPIERETSAVLPHDEPERDRNMAALLSAPVEQIDGLTRAKPRGTARTAALKPVSKAEKARVFKANLAAESAKKVKKPAVKVDKAAE